LQRLRNFAPFVRPSVITLKKPVVTTIELGTWPPLAYFDPMIVTSFRLLLDEPVFAGVVTL
jgi:hypothetical protein